MPRNSGTGVWSPPPNITAISGAPIESADWNALISDLATTLNAAWPIGIGGTGVSSLAGFLGTLGGLPLAGGVMIGPLTLSGDATASLHAVTKQQFDAGLATKAPMSHSQTADTITDFSAGVASALGTTSVNALSDVTLSSLAVGDSFRWDGTAFVNVKTTTHVLGSLSSVGRLEVNHGRGYIPANISFYVRNVSAEWGWSVGDIATVSSLVKYPDGAQRYPYSFFWSASKVGVLAPSDATDYLLICDKTTSIQQYLTPAKWEFIAVISG